ncbi:MAG: hypothetical protein HYY16_07860 [Planctomycetes bacterium]|nr:hypothetical protein [Planctomycetota bacterium]
MDYPPGSVPPPMSAPPPVPAAPMLQPRKSGVMKWVLIGCGAATVLGVLLCGTGIYLVYHFGSKAIQEVVAKAKPLIETNEKVKAELGEIKEIKPRLSEFSAEKVNGQAVVKCTLDVVGERGKGVVRVELTGEKDGNTSYVTLTFEGAQGPVPIGTWRGDREDHWTPVGEQD